MTKLVNEINYYFEMLRGLKLELESLPDGSLIKVTNNAYCHKVNGKRIAITSNPEMIYKLARKKFILVFIWSIEKNLNSMKKDSRCFSEKTQKVSVDSLVSLHPRGIIQSLPKSYQGLSESCFYHPFASEWLMEDAVSNSYKEELKTYKSRSGNLFRSRGEQSFANLLEDNGLPYKSDVKLVLGGATKFPDFIVLNPFVGKVFVLEFFGLADQSGYDKQMNSKMDWYRMNGFDVIYLFESDIRDTQHLQQLIDEKIWRI